MAKVTENLVSEITNSETVQIATEVKQLHTELSELETKFTNKKTELVGKVKTQWDTDVIAESFYPKNYKMETTEGIVQVEAKVATAKGAMEETMRPLLESLFESFTDTLFEEESVLESVVDKRQVLMALLGPGINLNDIEITFKNPSLMKEIEKVGALTTRKVISPRAKFLDLVNKLPEDIRKKSEGFLKKFLDNAQSFVVVCGNRGKK